MKCRVKSPMHERNATILNFYILHVPENRTEVELFRHKFNSPGEGQNRLTKQNA